MSRVLKVIDRYFLTIASLMFMAAVWLIVKEETESRTVMILSLTGWLMSAVGWWCAESLRRVADFWRARSKNNEGQSND